MKNIKMFVVLILILSISFVSCSKKSAIDNEERQSGSEQTLPQHEFAINDYYKIVKHSDDRYTLILYSRDKSIMREEEYPREPYISLLENEIIQITLSVGSPASYVHYFDVKTNRISEEFFNPILAEQGKIIIIEDGQLIVSDIFDRSIVYQKIKRNFSATANPSSAILEAKFIENAKLLIVYLEGDKQSEKLEIIHLRE
ncbi:hypothetical protein [Anaerosolibacter sp.]|uniref:hypothetical protein n=1 Tax=Anaerosolibacter sp. TaxID=1872527 RepID=UPI0039EEAC83